MSFKMDGFDELNKHLDSMAKNAEKLSGNNEVSSNDLYPDSFMRKNSKFNNFSEFLESVGSTDNDSFEKIPSDQLDKSVSLNTKFSNWNEMEKSATSEYVSHQLGL